MTGPQHAHVPHTVLSVRIELGLALTVTPTVEFVLHFEPEPKHVLVVLLFGLDTHVMSGKDVVCGIALADTIDRAVHVVEGDLCEGIRGSKRGKRHDGGGLER